MAILKAGADAGNSGLKLNVLGLDPLFIPSIYSHHIGEATNILSDEDISVEDLENNIDVTISSPTLKANNLRYIIGQKWLMKTLKVLKWKRNRINRKMILCYLLH